MYTYPSVQAAFVPFSAPLEGIVRGPYVDERNLMTCGMGYLCDTGDAAGPAFLNLPWKHTDGSPVTNEEASAAYTHLKTGGFAGHGGGNQQNETDLRLDDAEIANLTDTKLASNEANIIRYVPNFPNLPADGQLLQHSMSWAMGSAFYPGFPSFTRALNAVTPDWKTAALQSWMKDTKDGWVPKTLDDDYSAHPPDLNAGLRPRNIANRQLAINAYNATQAGTPFSQLWWPSTSGVSTGGVFASGGGFTLAGFLKTLGIAAGVGGTVIGVNMVRTGDSFKTTVRKGEKLAESGVKRVRKLI